MTTWTITSKTSGATLGSCAAEIETARAEFVAAAEACGSDAVTEEAAILGAGRELLPPDALAVLDGGAPTAAYWDFLREQTEKAQAEHDSEVAAGHEWHEGA